MMHSVRGKACDRLHCGKSRRSGKGQVPARVQCPYAEWLLAAAGGLCYECCDAWSTGHGEVADLVVSRQEQSLLRAARAVRAAALRVMPMKVEQRDWEVGSEGWRRQRRRRGQQGGAFLIAR